MVSGVFRCAAIQKTLGSICSSSMDPELQKQFNNGNAVEALAESGTRSVEYLRNASDDLVERVAKITDVLNNMEYTSLLELVRNIGIKPETSAVSAISRNAVFTENLKSRLT